MSINKIANDVYLPPVVLCRRDNFYIAKRFFKKEMKLKKANRRNLKGRA